MKKIIFISFALLLISACGHKGGSTVLPPNNAPSISNLYFSPTSANVGDGGGAITITGTYDFLDADGNISTAKIKWTDTLGHSGTITGTASLSGHTSGTAYFEIVGASTAVATTYNIDFFVMDSFGLSSNHLYATWTVY